MIAACGVVLDNAILIVGAMAVGPEFGPLAGICTAIVQRAPRLALRSAIALLVGFAAAIVATVAFSWLMSTFGLFSEAKLQADQTVKAQQDLRDKTQNQAEQLKKNQWVLPVTGYHLTARFGMAGGLWSSNHTGLDFATASGTPVVAVANGVITETGYAGAYGNQTIQTLDDGTEIWYCHQSSFGVSEGDVVSAGEVIGAVGSTGNVTGSHLHIEVRPGGGDPVDPYAAFIVHGVTP